MRRMNRLMIIRAIVALRLIEASDGVQLGRLAQAWGVRQAGASKVAATLVARGVLRRAGGRYSPGPYAALWRRKWRLSGAQSGAETDTHHSQGDQPDGQEHAASTS